MEWKYAGNMDTIAGVKKGRKSIGRWKASNEVMPSGPHPISLQITPICKENKKDEPLFGSGASFHDYPTQILHNFTSFKPSLLPFQHPKLGYIILDIIIKVTLKHVFYIIFTYKPCIFRIHVNVINK